MAKYTLPVAGPDKLGGVMIGDDFDIDKSGTLNIKDMATLRQQLSNLIAGVEPGKELIAAAITEKKVPTSADDSFTAMAENIRNISGGISYKSLGIVIEYLPYTEVTE